MPRVTEPKVYLDVCCLNRLFDDQRQTRLHLETRAVLALLDQPARGVWAWYSSEVVEFEICHLPNPARQRDLKLLLELAHRTLPVGPAPVARARHLASLGLAALDALHIACAEAGAVDVLLTTDDRLLSAAAQWRNELTIPIDNPTSWIMGGNMSPTEQMSSDQIREVGLELLLRELGPAATIRFLRQFEAGHGNYSEDRHQWLDGLSLDTILTEIQQNCQPERHKP